MSLRSTLLTAAALLAVAAGLFVVIERQLAGSWLFLGVHPEVIDVLSESLDDQRDLAELAPAEAELYRERFEERETLLRRLRVVEMSRRDLVRRFEWVLLGLFGAVLAAAGVARGLEVRRDRRRLALLRQALADLCAGRPDILPGVKGRDPIGRVGAMIEETSRVMARDRRRLHALENLSAWQEAARRHAHEMRTPLTAAQLEVARLRQSGEGVDEVADSLSQELDRLAVFTRRFTSFARLPRPRREPLDLAELLERFTASFADAWDGLDLVFEAPEAETAGAAGAGEAGAGGGTFVVAGDREMLRQVWVNLCDNSSLARESVPAFRARDGAKDGRERGTVTFRLHRRGDRVLLDVADDGPGIDPAVRRRLFEPYATTRRVGEGMGLGLAISKKILLDHGGDLELLEENRPQGEAGAGGAAFRLSFPSLEAEETEEPEEESA